VTITAFLGCAHIHTPDFVKMVHTRSEVEVRRVWDYDAGRAARVAGELGSVQCESMDQILADRDIDSIVIASETVHHKQLVIESARAGKHIFVDKPLAIKSKDAYEIARAVEDAGVVFQTGYFRRGEPAMRFLRDEIRRGHLGTITRIRIVIGHGGALEGWFDHEWRWMADPALAGFGAFGDVGTHALDLLLWMFGEPVVASVVASVQNSTDRDAECDEYGEGLVLFGDGKLGSIAASWIDRHAPFSVEISGSAGHAHLEAGTLHYQSDRRDGAESGDEPWTLLPEPLADSFELYFEALAGAQNVPLTTVREAADRVAIMEALYKSADSGRWIRPKVGEANQTHPTEE
jgi:predicted dehydrogenase